MKRKKPTPILTTNDFLNFDLIGICIFYFTLIAVFFNFNTFYYILFQDPISSIESSGIAFGLINFKPNLIIQIITIVRTKAINTKATRYHKSLFVDAFIKFITARNKVPYVTMNNNPPIKIKNNNERVTPTNLWVLI